MRHVCRGGPGHAGGALPAAADIYLAAAGSTRRLDLAVTGERDLIAFQPDHAAALGQAAGLQRAGMVDDAAQHVVGGAGGENDEAAGRLHGLAVFHQRGHRRRLHFHARQTTSIELQRVRVAGGQRYRAQLRDDDAVVAHLGRQQGDVAVDVRIEVAVVDHAARRAVAGEAVVAGHEVGVGNRMCGGDQSADVDAGGGAEVDPGGVGEEDLAVGVEVAEDLAGVAGEHAVERHGAGRGLDEIHRRSAADVEAPPVDGGALRGLGDVHGRAGLRDGGLPGDHLAAGGQGMG